MWVHEDLASHQDPGIIATPGMAACRTSPTPPPFRLLHGTSASDDHEKAVLTRLKQQCGAQFTSKMEGMVNDLQLAKEKERQFDEWRESKGLTLPIDMNVTVLTTGFWPSYKVGGWVFVCWGLG